MDCHFPAVGLVPVPVPASGQEEASAGYETLRTDCQRVSVVGINPPEEVTPVDSLIAGEGKSGIGLWSRDRYGVQSELAGKRVKRGWQPGMEDGLFVNVGLEPVVEELVLWNGGHDGNEWFGKMDQLPWYHS